MASVRTVTGALSALLFVGAADAAAPEHVDNFALLDQNGKYHDLYYLSDAKAVVLMTHENDCDAVSDALPALEAAKTAYAGKGVEFLMVNSQDARAAIAEKAQASIPVLVDERRLVSESLQLKRASEVLVIDPQGWKIAYRGPVAARKDNLLNGALDAVLAGQPVKKAKVAAKGCSIKLAKTGSTGKRVSYSTEIAPMLIDNCVTCHRAGGIGPFAMTDYNVVRGFAPMIREVVRTKRMPPWHADPHVGVFKDARGLTTEEAQKLVHWIEAGALAARVPDTARRVQEAVGGMGLRRAGPGGRSACLRRAGDRHRRLSALRRSRTDRTRCVGARDGHDSGRTRRGASRDRRRLRPGAAGA